MRFLNSGFSRNIFLRFPDYPFRKFTKIFGAQGAPPVPTAPVVKLAYSSHEDSLSGLLTLRKANILLY
jgi:hypothetical protein